MRHKLPVMVPILLLVLALLVPVTSCHKNPATAGIPAPAPTSVPGAVNSLDAYAFRVISDAQAAIHSVKIWAQCDGAGPATTSVDGKDEKCDPSMGKFPPAYKPYLNDAIKAYNVAQSPAKAYHDGATTDVAGLATSLTQLSQSVTILLSKS